MAKDSQQSLSLEDRLKQQRLVMEKLAAATTMVAGLNSVLEHICRELSWDGGLIWMIDDETQDLVVKSICGEARGSMTSLSFGQDCPGKVWASGQPVVQKGDDRSNALEYCLPAKMAGKVKGIIQLFRKENSQGDPDPEFYGALADLVGMFIWGSRGSEKAQRLQDQLQLAQAEASKGQERSQALTEMLGQTRHAAAESVAFKAQFVEEINHKIRTPMNGISGVVDLLRKTKLSETQSEFVEIIKQSGEVLVDVVDELLELSKLSADAPSSDSLELEPVAISDSTDDLRLLIVNGLIGTCEVTDAYAMSQGWQCDTTSRGSEAVNTLRQALRAGNPYQLLICEIVLPDMDAFELAHLIKQDPLIAATKMIVVATYQTPEQADRALRAGFAGYMAKPTKQSQFVEAVLHALGRDKTPQQLPLISARAVNEHGLILVAEDNPVNQKVAFLQLQDLGFATHIVSNGREAVEAAGRTAYDAILMDCQMPELDGLEATRLIRDAEQEGGRRVPIVAVTAHALGADKDRCFQAGMDDYVSKPVTADKLQAILNKWIPQNELLQFAPEGDNEVMNNQPDSAQFGNTAPVDVANLQDMLGDEATKDVLGLFLDSTEQILGKIKRALESQDIKLLKEAAHELKGACFSVGASAMANDCLRLEDCAREAAWQEAWTIKDGLTAGLENTRHYIDGLYRA